MFDHLRQERADVVAAAQNAAAAAAAATAAASQQLAVAQSQVPPAQAAVVQAQLNAQMANTARATAQSVVDQQQGAVNSATNARNNAQSRVDDIAGKEPNNPLPNGHPNPRYLEWVRELAAAEEALTSAQSALTAAVAALGQAAQQRDAAVAAAATAAAGLAAAQNQVAARLTAVGPATAGVTTAQDAESVAQQQVAAARAGVTALDERAARLVADPLNRPDLEVAADAEYAELAARRADRHALMSDRAVRYDDRAALLAAHDAALAGLTPTRDAIAGWADVGRFGSLVSAREWVDGILTAAQSQQGRPAAERTDDLDAAQTALDQAVAFVRASIAQATTERNEARSILTAAANVLSDHQSDQP